MVRGMNDTSFDTAPSYFRALTDLHHSISLGIMLG